MSQWVNHEGSIPRIIVLRADGLPRSNTPLIIIIIIIIAQRDSDTRESGGWGGGGG